MSAEFISGTHCDDCERVEPLKEYRDGDWPRYLCDDCAEERWLSGHYVSPYDASAK